MRGYIRENNIQAAMRVNLVPRRSGTFVWSLLRSRGTRVFALYRSNLWRIAQRCRSSREPLLYELSCVIEGYMRRTKASFSNACVAW